MYFAYSLLFALGSLLLAPYYAWRYRKTPLLRSSWRDRLGFTGARSAQPGAVWVHAVSVGETLAVAGLVEQLAARFPSREIFLSHVTPTGREAGEKRLPQVAGRFFLPLDLAGPMRRAMRRVRPALLLIVETELWPNMLRAAHQCGARVAMVNARLSDRSLRGYRLGRFAMRRILDNVDLIMAQTPEDAARFSEIGAATDRIIMTGNLKFDGRPPKSCPVVPPLKDALAGAERHPIVIAASTMPGEEEIVLSAWDEVKRAYPRALLILTPRHPARFDQVARLLGSRSFVRRTELAAGVPEMIRQLTSSDLSSSPPSQYAPEVLLLDTLGELQSFFDLADVVFIGGSLVPTGGHNLLEPAWWSKPVIFGPHMENFRDAARLFLDAGAAAQVRNGSALAAEIIALLRDEPRRRALGEAAYRVVQSQSGATERVLEQLVHLLEPATAPPHAGERAGESR